MSAGGLGDLRTVTLTLNGSERTVAMPAHRTLLDALREELRLPGTKSCCAEGECGACTVLLDGRAVNACLVLCAEAEGHEVVTVEGLSAHGLTDLVGPEAPEQTGGGRREAQTDQEFARGEPANHRGADQPPRPAARYTPAPTTRSSSTARTART